MAIELGVGKRFRSTVCGTEVVILRSPGGPVELACGGASMVPVGTDVETTGGLDPQFAGGTLVGKRYTDSANTLELLCTKSGEGNLSLSGISLEAKAAASLPSSD